MIPVYRRQLTVISRLPTGDACGIDAAYVKFSSKQPTELVIGAYGSVVFEMRSPKRLLETDSLVTSEFQDICLICCSSKIINRNIRN